MRPDPTRPKTPTISPGRMAKLTGPMPGGKQAFDAQERLRAGPTALWNGALAALNAFADDGVDKNITIEFRNLARQHDTSAAQHGHAVGEGEDLAEPVRDIQQGHILLLQFEKMFAERRRFAFG